MKRHLIPEPSEESHQRFESWLRQQMKNEMLNEGSGFTESSASCAANNNNNRILYSPEAPSSYEKMIPSSGFLSQKETPRCDTERPKQYVPTKTRMRTSFDPELELPKLHQWYLENPHPTRQQVGYFSLNILEYFCVQCCFYLVATLMTKNAKRY